MQTKEEQQQQQQHKDAIITFTEEVLQARGIECDSRISTISEEQLNEILEEVRQLCKKNKKSKEKDNSSKLLYNKQIE
jgi:ribosomal protein S13